MPDFNVPAGGPGRILRAAIAFTLLALCVLLTSSAAYAASEAKPCAAEPADTSVAYGDVITGSNCVITLADVDIVRFTGQTNDLVRIVGLQLIEQYPNNISIQLLAPDGQSLATAGSNTILGVYSAQIQLRLPTDGTYSVIVRESGNDASIHYALTLDRIDPVRTTLTTLTYTAPIADEINPPPEQDGYLISATAGNVIDLTGVLTTGDYPMNLCLELFAPGGGLFQSGCTNTILGVRAANFPLVTVPTTGTYLLVVSEASNDGQIGYNLVLNCVNGPCPPPPPNPPCTLHVAPSYTNPTLTLDFTLGTRNAATWTAWLVVQNNAIRLWSGQIGRTDPPKAVTKTIPLAPSGTIGVLTTLSNASGITCSEWKRVATGQPPGADLLPDSEP